MKAEAGVPVLAHKGHARRLALDQDALLGGLVLVELAPMQEGIRHEEGEAQDADARRDAGADQAFQGQLLAFFQLQAGRAGGPEVAQEDGQGQGQGGALACQGGGIGQARRHAPAPLTRARHARGAIEHRHAEASHPRVDREEMRELDVERGARQERGGQESGPGAHQLQAQ